MLAPNFLEHKKKFNLTFAKVSYTEFNLKLYKKLNGW